MSKRIKTKNKRSKQHHLNVSPIQQQLTNILARAVNLHHAGKLQEAEVIYRQILQGNPNHDDALHLLGVIAHQVGKNDTAVDLISKAISINSSAPNFHNNLGNALKNQGKLDEAFKCFENAIRLKPNYAEACLNIGNLLKEEGKLDEAIEHYQKAIRLKPDYADAYNNLGNVLKEQGELDKAIKYLKKAIMLKPHLAEVHFNLGSAFKEQNKLDLAIEYFKKAIRLKSDFAEVYNSVGNILKEQGKLAEAIKHYQKAISLKPDFAEAFHNLGHSFEKEGKFSEAIDYYEKAIDLKSDFAEVYNNLGNVLKGQGKLYEGIEHYQKAIDNDPGFAETHFNKGILLLLMGNFEEGWPEYEWRFRSKEVAQQIGYCSFKKPIWDGSPLAGRTLLVCSEQGIGDTFQFIRYLPLVKGCGGRVIFECQKEVMQLLDGFPGINLLAEKPVNEDILESFDIYTHLLSLPGIFGTTLDTIFAEVPYLRANHELVKEWRSQIDCETFKIGLIWAGNPAHKDDHNRSCKLLDFEPLTNVSGVQLFSLQKGVASNQLSDPPKNMTIVNIGDQLEDFSHTAAVIINLDLIISVDTAVVHLAGALGKPVWTLLPFVPDWRWMMNRENSPWYPTMRLFRQTKPGDWKSVIENVAKKLNRTVMGDA